MNEDFKEKEKQLLIKTEKLLKDYISTYAKEKRAQMDIFEENRIKKLIERAIDGELDFLQNEPETYYDLYCRDHELN